jgi:RNA polymerase sigma factor (sigma-70 family)
MVLAAGHASTAASREALATLCERYWYPVYAFVRRNGFGAEDAEDLTQAFFSKLIEKDFVRDANPARGRFRAFLLTATKHFVSNERDRAMTIKRGGTRTILSLEGEIAERRYLAEPVDQLSPDRIFERRWALTILDRALARLRDEQERTGNGDRFDRLKGWLTGDQESYASLSKELGMSEAALKVAVHRLRKRYREILRSEIGDTLDDASNVDDEFRDLLAALV